MKKYIPFIVGIGLLMETLDISVINTAIPEMSVTLQSNPISLKLAITSYLLTLASFIPISGYVADKYGAKKTYISAMIVFLIGSSLCGFANSLAWLVVGRLIQGVGGAMMTPVGRLILIKTYTKTELTKAYSSYTTLGQFGTAIGPLVGGLFSTYFSWRYIFFVNVPFSLCALWLTYAMVPNYKLDEVQQFDFKGFILFGVSAGLISFSASLFSEDVLPEFVTYGMFIGGAILLLIFWGYASKITNPSLNMRLFKLRTFRISLLGSLVMRTAIGGIPFILPLLLQIGYGYTPFESGLMLVPYGIAMVVAKFFVKKFLHRYGFRTMLIVNPCIITVLFLALAFLAKDFNLIAVVGGIFLMGFFSSMQFTYMTLFSFVDIKPADDSSATSLGAVTQQLSMSFGVCAVAIILSVLNPQSVKNILSINSFMYTILILGLISASTLFIFTNIKKTDGFKKV